MGFDVLVIVFPTGLTGGVLVAGFFAVFIPGVDGWVRVLEVQGRS